MFVRALETTCFSSKSAMSSCSLVAWLIPLVHTKGLAALWPSASCGRRSSSESVFFGIFLFYSGHLARHSELLSDPASPVSALFLVSKDCTTILKLNRRAVKSRVDLVTASSITFILASVPMDKTSILVPYSQTDSSYLPLISFCWVFFFLLFCSYGNLL